MISNEFFNLPIKKIWYNFISKLKISNLQIYFNHATVLQILIHRIKYIFDLTICYKAFWFIKFDQKRFRCKFRFWFKYLKKCCIIVLYSTYTPLHKEKNNPNFNSLGNQNYIYNHEIGLNADCYINFYCFVFLFCFSLFYQFLLHNSNIMS